MHHTPRTEPPTSTQHPSPWVNTVGVDSLQCTPPEPGPNWNGSKPTPLSLPTVVSDKTGKLQFERFGLLEENGSASVYEVKDWQGVHLACNVVTKASLATKRAKIKLYAKIKIHCSLDHPNIVSFRECFEDNENVYTILELCPSGSLMDMLLRRGYVAEPEARFFMVQVIGACHYMHTHRVIHRDLKLKNLLLDAKMNVKVGNFGLARLTDNPGDKRMPIYGTLHDIAPWVLFNTDNRQGIEVDLLFIGFILYMLIVGHPPFKRQEGDAKALYTRIRATEYEFPTDRAFSSTAQHLVSQILAPHASKCPTLNAIIDHAFFTQGTFPSHIPISAHDSPPDFRHITKYQSDSNFKRLRKHSLLDVDFNAAGISTPWLTSGVGASIPVFGSSGPAVGRTVSKNGTIGSILRQQRELEEAVQPGSSISVLLSLARRPLFLGNASGGEPRVDGNPLRMGNMAQEFHTDQENVESTLRKTRIKGLEACNTSNFAQMESVQEEVDTDEHGYEGDEEGEKSVVRERCCEREDIIPAPILVSARERSAVRERCCEREDLISAPILVPSREYVPRLSSTRNRVPLRVKKFINIHPGLFSSIFHFSLSFNKTITESTPTPTPVSVPELKLNSFDSVAQTLATAFDAKAAGRVFPDHYSRNGQILPLPDERVFIVGWVDFCHEYEMGYVLTDGSVGVHFNDSTTLVLSGDKVHFDYWTLYQAGAVYVRKSYTVHIYPEELKLKVYLLTQFERYNIDRLYKERSYTYKNVARKDGMEWVQKHFRMEHVSVFMLSHDVVQCHFDGHSTLILSSNGHLVTHIDKYHTITRHPLRDIMAASISLLASSQFTSSISRLQQEQDVANLKQHIMDKLKISLDSFKKILGSEGEIPPAKDTYKAVNMANISLCSRESASCCSKASSRTVSTDYGLFYTRRAYSQETFERSFI
ncbi:hypothetical protein CVT25_001806 [Psilocybe cyanescens]|uniref:Polo kinase n=1 Tax=Psilocybe cyanescens TaxID=93625 RepID=A0A409W026_PSICY|nr:hypothetical protein CVT25_001806 [Psilocybe cyanescens]